MNVMEAIKERRSVRKYDSRPIEEEKLHAVLEAGRLAPSGNNKQLWKFIVVKDREKISAMVEAAAGQKFVGEAPVVLVACALDDHTMKCGQPAPTVDLSIATSFMILEACEQGLGTCWLGSFYADKVKKLLNIPDCVQVVAVTPLGYPAEKPAPRTRKDIGEVVSYDKF